MLNVTLYQGNANQTHNEVPSYASQNVCYQKVYKQMLDRVQRKSWWKCKIVQPLWRTV